MHGAAVAASPRFGTFPFDWDTGEVDVTKNWLDPRVPASIVDELARRGLWFQMEPEADLGFGVAVTIDSGEPDAGAIRTYGATVAIQQY
jgi:hypothetical protein